MRPPRGRINWPELALKARGRAGTGKLLSKVAARACVELSSKSISHIVNGRQLPVADQAVWLYQYATAPEIDTPKTIATPATTGFRWHF